MHSLHLRFAVVLIWFVCTKAVFSLESKMTLFTVEVYFGSYKASQPHFNFFCCVQKLCFKTNLKVHSLHFNFVHVLIWFVCTKVAFSLESKVALVTFERYFESYEASQGRPVLPKLMFFWKKSEGGEGSFPIQKISLPFFVFQTVYFSPKFWKKCHLQSKKFHCKFTQVNAYLRFFAKKNAM